MRRLFAKPLVRWCLAFVAGIAITLFTALTKGLGGDLPAALVMRYLSDGCFVASVFIGGLGLLVWISTTGIFDIFAYGFSSLLTLFTSLRSPKDQIAYVDYKAFRDEKRKPARLEWLITGLVFLILSALLLAGYYKLSAGNP